MTRRFDRRNPWSPGQRLRFRPEVESLEARATPAVLTWATPADGLADEVVIRLDSKATRVEILDNGVVVKSARLNNVDAVQIIGNADTDRLTVDYSAGFYQVPISFAAAGGTDAIISIGDTNYTLTDGKLTSSGGGVVTFTNVESAELTGGPSANIIDASAYSGPTVLKGEGGNDTISGGKGDDVIHGGDGDDLLISITHGDDTIFSGAGKDWLRLDTGSTITSINSGGSDTVDMSPSDQPIDATVTGGGVTVDGGDGTVTGTGAGPYTTVIGTGGDDCFTDRGPHDYTFDGGLGDDCYFLDPSSPNTDILRDSGGNDSTFFTDSTDPVDVDLGVTDGGVGVVDGAGDRVLFFGEFENATGSSGDDSITGSDADNTLDGGPGNDTVDGRGGTNTIRTVPGSTDTFRGTDGFDIIDFSGANLAISLNLGLPSGSEQKVDAAGNRVILVGTIEVVIGSQHGDVLSGDNGPNFLLGGGGDDVLQGQGGDDVLVGGDGADELIGGGEEDILIGGRGADRLKGNAGEDLLIAGSTAFDMNLDALQAIQAEWTGPGSYETRVRHLRGEEAGVPNAGYYLNVAPTLLSPKPTVFDDGEVDTLTGAQQLDWFIIDVGDVITDNVQPGTGEFIDLTTPGP